MTKGDERLRNIMLKVERSREHCAELNDCVQGFLATTPFEVDVRSNNKGPGITYFVSKVDPIPAKLSLIFGDVIQCLATALDHLAYQLICSDTNDCPPAPRDIYFPTASSEERYTQSKAKRLQGALPETIHAIDGIRPYKGGNDHLWQLQQLNSIEKHRMLLTVGSQAVGTDLASLMASSLKSHPSYRPEMALPFLAMRGKMFLRPDAHFPLEVGQELITYQDTSERDSSLQFGFALGINEPDILQHQDFFEPLRWFEKAVINAISQTKHLLR